ncbi:MAG: T9SS type A sorting domain-containing protein, partial [Candidatus Cloacimonetes bacterium]|nr:T9SS type A sorting domain-containing protein [Candidatus Cloacimonadota bacterium]
LSSMSNNSFSLKISGQDKFGNTNTIVQHIPISSVYASKSSILGMDKLTIDIPKDAVSSDQRVVLIPAESTVTPRQAELELIEELPSLLHPLSLNKSSQIQGSLSSVSPSQLPTNAGLFTLVDGEWAFVSKLQWTGDNSFQASSSHLGPMALFKDPVSPRIEMLGIKDRDKLEFLVEDFGSGVDWQNTYFQNGSERYIGQLDEKSQLYQVQIPQSVNRVEGHLISSDRIGNQIHSSLIQANISRVFQFQPGIYPNPVRNQMNFELNTNFIPDSAEMYVYDSSSRLVYSQSLNLGGVRDTYTWDLRNRRGGEVKNGVYFLRLKVTENGRTHKKDLKFAVLK